MGIWWIEHGGTYKHGIKRLFQSAGKEEVRLLVNVPTLELHLQTKDYVSQGMGEPLMKCLNLQHIHLHLRIL